MNRRFLTRRALLRVAAALLLVGLAAPQAWAWYHLRAAKHALASYHPEQARAALQSCEHVWGGWPGVRLLSARAAWQDTDFAASFEELRQAQRLSGGATEETAFEWALLQAAAGNFAEVEEYLQKRGEQDPELAPLVWEALACGYLRAFRTPDAMACLTLWLRKQPDNVRALELRGLTYVIGKGVTRGADDFRKVLAIDPDRRVTRWRLVGCLLDLGGYDEATQHLERMVRESPDDPNLTARLARCYLMTQRSADAQQLLDRVLATHPEHGLCLRVRGQLALGQKQPDVAEEYLRRAAGVTPEDYQTQWLLFEALRQQGKMEDAKRQQQRAEEVKDRSERIGELQSRKLAEQPLDPSLHYELGMLLWRTGQTDAGEQSMLRALALDPDHQLTHAALADFYERGGDKPRAEEHRKKAAR